MNIAVIFAGGSGTRMTNADKPKQFLMVHGKPIIVHTVEVFQKHPEIDGIVVACLKDWIPYVEEMKKRYSLDKLGAIVPGGETGQMSIYNGLKAVKELYGYTAVSGERNIVLIHDGVRPLIDAKVISDNISAVKKYGSAITCTPANETVILVSEDIAAEKEAGAAEQGVEQTREKAGAAEQGIEQTCEKTGAVGYSKEHGHVESVPDRSRSRFAKAPQSFFLDDILSVEEKAVGEGKTNMIDSCTLMKEYGYPLHTVIGPYYNIKITTPEDFIIYRALYDAIENEQLG